METVKEPCCHNWRCPTAQPPFELLLGGHQRPELSDHADLGVGSIMFDQVPRDKPCKNSEAK